MAKHSGTILAGRTLGLLGWTDRKTNGHIRPSLRYASGCLDQNLTDDAAAAVGARRVEKDDLSGLPMFSRSTSS